MSSCMSHAGSSPMSSFIKLRDSMGTRSHSINHLKWRQWMNSFRESCNNVGSQVSMSELRVIAAHFSQYPSVQKRHEIFSLIGREASVDVPDSSGHPLARAFLEAGLHVLSSDDRRFRRTQIDEANAKTRDVLSAYTQGLETVTSESIYLMALGKRQGWLDASLPSFDMTADQTSALHDSPFPVRTEYIWGLCQIRGSCPKLHRLFDLSTDLSLFNFEQHLTERGSPLSSSVKHLLQLHEAYNFFAPESHAFGNISDCVHSVPDNMASHAIWWRAVSNGFLDALAIQWARICSNNADHLSENERWMAITGLEHLLRNGKTNRRQISQKDLEQINRAIALLNRPKRSDIAWKSPLGLIHSLSR